MIAEDVARGFEVTGLAHRVHEGTKLTTDQLVANVLTLTAEDLVGYDAVVDAVGAWEDETAYVVHDGLHRIVQLLKGTDTRFLKVGGTNTLYIACDVGGLADELQFANVRVVESFHGVAVPVARRGQPTAGGTARSGWRVRRSGSAARGCPVPGRSERAAARQCCGPCGHIRSRNLPLVGRGR